jgi:predicted RNA-binding Zn-ribbon protein involved in translation (DUF1610 family)
MLKEWLKRLVGSVRRVFGGNAVRPAKRFIVHSTAQVPAQTTTTASTRAAQAAPSRSGGGRFVVASATRPKICPQCRTQDRVTRTAESHFECKACGFQWN